MLDSIALDVQALVNLLSRLRPELLDQICAKHPGYTETLRPGKLLGQDNASQSQLLIDLALNTNGLIKQECLSIHRLLTARLQGSGRLRLIGSTIATVSAGALIAALTLGIPKLVIAFAVLTVFATAFMLVGECLEGYFGRQRGFREMQDRLLKNLLEVADVEAELRLMEFRGNFDGIEPQIRRLNAVAVTTQQIQHLAG
ncbi:hypothetical protein ACH50O_05500 [Methylomonas sp. 2BW1-5-20]|uniref:hypothetical protein n=1 Tax=Methylomonas sp. 2BW1-5-20 TaxID=3376686 RepID=UPI004052F058